MKNYKKKVRRQTHPQTHRKDLYFSMIDYTTKSKVCQALEQFKGSKLMQKKISKILQEHLENTKQTAKAERVKECATSVSFKVWRDEDRTTKLHTINLCRERLCPNCSTALSRAKFFEVKSAFEGRESVYLITLTVDNVAGALLRATLSKMQKALKAMLRKLSIRYYYRSFEITKGAKGTYHPHIHLLTEMTEKPTNKKIRETWSECVHKAGIHTKHAWVMVDIRKVDSDKGYMELCKYVTKPTDVTKDTIIDLEPAVKGLQLKRGSKEVTADIKKYRAQTASEREKREKELDAFGWDVELYMWNNENYERA